MADNKQNMKEGPHIPSINEPASPGPTQTVLLGNRVLVETLPNTSSVGNEENYAQKHQNKKQIERDAWSQLTSEEQRIISTKLHGDNRATPQEVFNKKFGQGRTKEETTALVISVKNILDVIGAHSNSAIWQQVKSIEGGWPNSKGDKIHGSLHLTVNNRDTFLKTLGNNNYDVDRYYEVVNRDKQHPIRRENHLHSARYITKYPDQVSMHFVQQHQYKDERFDIHFDPKSSSFKHAVSPGKWISNTNGIPLFIPGRVIDQTISGLAHDDPKYFQSSAEQRHKLMDQGLVPGDKARIKGGATH